MAVESRRIIFGTLIVGAAVSAGLVASVAPPAKMKPAQVPSYAALSAPPVARSLVVLVALRPKIRQAPYAN